MINKEMNSLLTIASQKEWRWIGENKNRDTIISNSAIKIDSDGFLAHLDGSKDFHPRNSQWIFGITIGRRFTMYLGEL